VRESADPYDFASVVMLDLPGLDVLPAKMAENRITMGHSNTPAI